MNLCIYLLRGLQITATTTDVLHNSLSSLLFGTLQSLFRAWINKIVEYASGIADAFSIIFTLCYGDAIFLLVI